MTTAEILDADEHEPIRQAVRAVCRPFDDSYWRDHDENHQFPWEFYRAMAEGGWIGTAIPEPYGGGGAGVAEAAVVLEEVAASGAAMNGASAIHQQMFGMHAVVRHGSEALRRRYLPRVASGELQVAFGVTEPDAGSDTSTISTKAVARGDHYVVTGRKVWTSKATECEKVLLLARTTPREACPTRTAGLSLLLADLQRPEVMIRPIPKAGRNAVASCEVLFDELPVPSDDRVGDEGAGFQYLLSGLNAERILVAAEAVGIGKVAVRRAVQYSNERVVFDRPIGRNQGVAFPLAEVWAHLRAAELMIREAARLCDAGLPCGEQANIAKFLAADAGYRAADQAVQVHGGFGYAREYDVERYWREARLLRLAPITQEMVLNYLAEHALGLPRSY